MNKKEAKQVLTLSGNGKNVSSEQPQPVRKMVSSSTKTKTKQKGEKAIAKDVLSPSRNGISINSKQTQIFSEAGKTIAANKQYSGNNLSGH